MAKRNALGRGLEALIKQSETNFSDYRTHSMDKIDIQKIVVNPYQPRTYFDLESLEELAVSIKQLGIIQPITVREIEEGKYQIISGERRYRAAMIAELSEIPAYVRLADDNDMLELALVENIQRDDLDAIEIAVSYQRLIDECQLKQEEISERVGKKRSTIANYLRLLKLPAEIQLAIRQKQISMGHARALINIEQSESQLNILNDIIENDLSVRQVEEVVRQINNPELEQTVVIKPDTVSEIEQDAENLDEQENIMEINNNDDDNKGINPFVNVTEEQPSDQEKEIIIYEDRQLSENIPDSEEVQLKMRLSKSFGTKVEIKRDASGAGRLIIPFKTNEELQNILQMTEK